MIDTVNPDTYGINFRSRYDYRRYMKSDDFLKIYFDLPGLKTFIDYLNNKSFDEKKVKVLDIGGGIGVEANMLSQILKNASVFSMDFSTYGSKQAKKKFDLNQVQGDAQNPPFRHSQFDAIHAKDMYVHVGDKRNFFRVMSNILVVGGILLIVTAEDAVRDQRAWNLENTIRHAKNAGFELTFCNKNSIYKEVDIYGHSIPIPHDDWYTTASTPRYQLIFTKVREVTEDDFELTSRRYIFLSKIEKIKRMMKSIFKGN